MSKRKKKRKPIDRAFLREWLARMERKAGATPVSDEAIERFAVEHLDGKTRDQREEAIVGPWLGFLCGQMRASMLRMMEKRGADHPSRN